MIEDNVRLCLKKYEYRQNKIKDFEELKTDLQNAIDNTPNKQPLSDIKQSVEQSFIKWKLQRELSVKHSLSWNENNKGLESGVIAIVHKTKDNDQKPIIRIVRKV